MRHMNKSLNFALSVLITEIIHEQINVIYKELLLFISIYYSFTVNR